MAISLALSLARSFESTAVKKVSGRLARPACCLFIKVKQKVDPSAQVDHSLSTLPVSVSSSFHSLFAHPVSDNGFDARFAAASSFGAHERFTNPISDPVPPSPSLSLAPSLFFVK